MSKLDLAGNYKEDVCQYGLSLRDNKLHGQYALVYAAM